MYNIIYLESCGYDQHIWTYLGYKYHTCICPLHPGVCLGFWRPLYNGSCTTFAEELGDSLRQSYDLREWSKGHGNQICEMPPIKEVQNCSLVDTI